MATTNLRLYSYNQSTNVTTSAKLFTESTNISSACHRVFNVGSVGGQTLYAGGDLTYALNSSATYSSIYVTAGGQNYRLINDFPAVRLTNLGAKQRIGVYVQTEHWRHICPSNYVKPCKHTSSRGFGISGHYGNGFCPMIDASNPFGSYYCRGHYLYGIQVPYNCKIISSDMTNDGRAGEGGIFVISPSNWSYMNYRDHLLQYESGNNMWRFLYTSNACSDYQTKIIPKGYYIASWVENEYVSRLSTVTIKLAD